MGQRGKDEGWPPALPVLAGLSPADRLPQASCGARPHGLGEDGPSFVTAVGSPHLFPKSKKAPPTIRIKTFKKIIKTFLKSETNVR